MREIDQRIAEAVGDLKDAAQRLGRITKRTLRRIAMEYELDEAVLHARFEALVGTAPEHYEFDVSGTKLTRKIAVTKARELQRAGRKGYLTRYAALHGHVAQNGRTWLVYIGSYDCDAGCCHDFISPSLGVVSLDWGELRESFPSFCEGLISTGSTDKELRLR